MPKTRGDRFRYLAVLVLAGFVLLWVRALQLTVFEHADHLEAAREQQTKLTWIPSLRGSILDRSGEALALSVDGSSLAVDPSLLSNPGSLASTLDSLGILEASRVRTLLDAAESKRFVWLTRAAVPEQTARMLEKRFSPALIRVREPKRLYPLGEAAAPLVGATGVDGGGLLGVEARYERFLRGVDGRMLDFRSGSTKKHLGPGRVILSTPRVGATVELTIDARYQQIVSAHLNQAVEEQQARGGAAILLDSRTGEILALASMPRFCPESICSADSLALRNWAVSENYEPGSTYKLVAFAAALDSGLVTPDDWIDCHNGRRKVPGGFIHDHEKHQNLRVWEVLAQSSNIGTGIIAEIVGAEGFYNMERRLGFGVTTGVEVSGEERGKIPEPSAWSRRSLLTQAFGQEVSCTALQLAAAYGAVANGGLLMRPYLVRQIRKQDGTVLKHREPEIVRRAMRPETARTLREMMRLVITEGTGKKAEVEGYLPAGKTGTGQRFLPEEGTYSNEHYIASFAGFAPYDAPRWVCVVVLEEPRASIWGGSVAAPVFGHIINDVAQLELPATENPRNRIHWPAPEKELLALVPRIKGLTASLARTLVKQEGLFPCFEGRGTWVVSSEPESGSRCRQGDIVKIYVSDEPDSLEHAPGLADFRGLALRDAIHRARWHDLPVELRGCGWVVAQEPQPGTPVESIERLTFWLSADSCRAFAEWLSEDL